MYLVNTVFRSNDDAKYRLIQRDEKKVWLFPMERDTPVCDELTLGDFQKQCDQGSFVEIPDPYSELQFRKATEAEIRRGRENLELIKPLIEEGARPFEKNHLRNLIKDMSAGLEGNERLAWQRKIKRTLVLWWQRGQVPAVLMPDWAPKKEVREYKEKPGRKSSLTNAAPGLNDEIRKEFDRICRKMLLVPEHDSVKNAYCKFLHDWMASKNVSQEESPTFNQFRHYYTSTYPKADRAKAQSTAREYEKDVRPLTGSTYDIAKGPGHVYEIDSTLDNINLLNNDRTEVVGRPYLYVVTDVFTGMIVGFDLSFEAPQLKTAGDALFCAIEEKTSFCKRHGIDIVRRWWPAQGVPAKIVADNAELTTDQVLHLNRAYGIDVCFTSTGRGDQKGTVENSIGLIQYRVRHNLIRHGLVLKDGRILRKAGDKDSRGDAVLTLDDYRLMVIRAILILNRRKRINTPYDLPGNVPNRCLSIWKYYESRGKSFLRHETDPRILRLTLLKHYTPTCSAKGLCVEGIRYLPEDSEYLKYFRRYNSPQYLEGWQLVLDPSDVTHAWLQPDEARKPCKYVICSLAPSSAHLTGMTLRAAQEYIKTAVKTEAEEQLRDEAFKSEQMSLMDDIVNDAKSKKPADPRSVRKKVEGIRENRSNEIENRESGSPRVPISSDSMPAPPEKVPEPKETAASASSGSAETAFGLSEKKTHEKTSNHDRSAENRNLGLDMHFSGGNIDLE